MALFGPAPLFEGEDTTAYDELLARISGAVKPADIFKEIWVRDIVDLVWEALRLRRLKANLMTATAYGGLQQILKLLVGFLVPEAAQLLKPFAARTQVCDPGFRCGTKASRQRARVTVARASHMVSST